MPASTYSNTFIHITFLTVWHPAIFNWSYAVHYDEKKVAVVGVCEQKRDRNKDIRRVHEMKVEGRRYRDVQRKDGMYNQEGALLLFFQ